MIWSHIVGSLALFAGLISLSIAATGGVLERKSIWRAGLIGFFWSAAIVIAMLMVG